MIIRAVFAIALAFSVIAPLGAEESPRPYDFRERTRALAFDPTRFFPERIEPMMSIRYMGDDYGFPVYAIAIREGCTRADQGEERRTCGQRLTARMVRSPYEGDPPRPRARGQRLFAQIGQSDPQNDEALLRLLDGAGLEWFEADVRKCPAAMAHLATGRDLKFSPLLEPTDLPRPIVLHADKVAFAIGGHLTRSRYEGWLEAGSPGEWAAEFAASLETCWAPSTSVVPWRVIQQN